MKFTYPTTVPVITTVYTVNMWKIFFFVLIRKWTFELIERIVLSHVRLLFYLVIIFFITCGCIRVKPFIRPYFSNPTFNTQVAVPSAKHIFETRDFDFASFTPHSIQHHRMFFRHLRLDDTSYNRETRFEGRGWRWEVGRWLRHTDGRGDE